MKAITLLLTLLVSSFAYGQKLKTFKWLEGTWERQNTKLGSTAFEIWEMTVEGLKGKGLTMRGTDTVFIEKLSFATRDNKLFYVAEVKHNAEPTYFEITSWSKSGFVCENPTHDFPKKIVYALDGSTLTATISGNGKEIPFTFVRKI